MAEVVQFRRRDCWRTWFFDECEQFGLFGINQKHLGLLSLKGPGVVPYRVGTYLFLEDAPVFPASGGEFHRICGPCEVQAVTDPPEGSSIVYSAEGQPIVYLDSHPERGPWGNGTRVRKDVAGLDLKYRQTAKEFNYYPYRFRLRRAANWNEIILLHRSDCELRDGERI